MLSIILVYFQPLDLKFDRHNTLICNFGVRIISVPGGVVVVSVTGIVISEKDVETSDEVAMVTDPSLVVVVVAVVIACGVVT